MQIQGATALVTGANRGLGQVMARSLLQCGAHRVYGGARDPRSVREPGIVNVLSIASWLTNPAMGSYSASKAAARALTNAIRGELRDTGVHCGYIDTDMAAHVTGPKNTPEAVAEQTLAAVEAGRTEVLADERTRQAKAALGHTSGTTAPLPRQ
ncbi:SDR family NAD(P)-dependent oxidoreductase [Streptomyces adustus]|uniref:SDR family NAD(P)-dependent oxidoreductase n=1 Tax=Streptomyces adustus TaxID=1609272 RepID=UPI0035DBE9A7